MSITGWSLVRFVHVVGAMVWVGGQLLLSGVVLPVLRREVAAEARGPMVRAVATRFAVVTNAVVLPATIASGIALAYHRGVGWSTLTGPGYGRLLSTKLVLVIVSIGLAAAHGVVASRSPAGARNLAVLGLMASLGIVVFATALVP